MNNYDAVVVNLNPSLDWTWHIGNFTHGGLNRVQSARADAGSKGINVCTTAKNLNLNPLCIGFIFRENGGIIAEKLENAGIAHDFITVDGAVRVNIKLYDTSGAMTELNQPGAYVPENAQAELMGKLTGATLPKYLILTGSRPGNVPADYYARLCAAWRGLVLLDAEGEALRLAIGYDANEPLPQVPYLIKPNLFELQHTFGVTLTTREEIITFCRSQIIAKGVKIVCVSLGAKGALMISQEEAFFAPALALQVKAVQGAGDAMVAGILHALVHDKTKSLSALLQNAVAAASATIELEGTQMCDRPGFDKMLAKIAEKGLQPC
jgi:1-phosphofructokinase